MALDRVLHHNKPIRTVAEAWADKMVGWPSYQIIIQATWERGDRQKGALLALHRRGLWLTDGQKAMAGISAA